MKLKTLVTASMLLLMIFAMANAASKANFSGTWVMDKSKTKDCRQKWNRRWS